MCRKSYQASLLKIMMLIKIMIMMMMVIKIMMRKMLVMIF